MNLIQIYSEIDKLKKVILHRPGEEMENIIPDYLDMLLFDDIPYLKAAQKEHDIFADILRENGVEVLYLSGMAAEIFADPEVKKSFIDEFLPESGIFCENLNQSLQDFLLKLSPRDMVNTLISGVRKKDIQKSASLSDVLKDDYEFHLDPMPNLYFTRDPAACIGNGLTINTMKTPVRRRETLFIKYLYNHHPVFKGSKTPLWYDRTLPASIEGGDILVLSQDTLAIGCSERTSADAIEYVSARLFEADENFKRTLVFQIQKKRAYMHLDTVFTMVDYDKFAIHPGIENNLSLYEITKGKGKQLNFRHCDEGLVSSLKNVLNTGAIDLIRCGGNDIITASREQWSDGSNTLAIAPGTVVVYERNSVSNDLLDKHGVKVVTMPSSELSRGRGGPRCMSMPVYRER